MAKINKNNETNKINSGNRLLEKELLDLFHEDFSPLEFGGIIGYEYIEENNSIVGQVMSVDSLIYNFYLDPEIGRPQLQRFI